MSSPDIGTRTAAEAASSDRATAELVPILDQPLSREEIGRIAANLIQKNIDFKTSGDRILVPSERKIEALSILSYHGAVPKDDAAEFDDIIKQISPWDSIGRQNAVFNNAIFNHGRELTLSRIISNFPDVASAVVLIDPRTERHIGADIEPTATISLRMKTGVKPDRQLVKAAASIVAGAQSGLAMNNIRVVVDGIAQTLSDDESGDGPDGGAIMELRQNAE